MRVFVSSTVYDLIDIRAEVETLLRELHLTPVMSDDNLSDFNLAFNANSIEACLLNVDSSDAVIVILDQRYGPRLGKCGFDNVSATHLEYRRAKKHQKPIYFYVRDRLEADFNIAHKNKSLDGVTFSWISPDDVALFEFLQEHRKLRNKSSESNWFSLFRTSQDLKAAIRRHFEPVVKPQVLLDAINTNQFPIFTFDVDADPINIGIKPSIKCTLVITNVGLVPAFNVTSQWDINNTKVERKDILASGQNIHAVVIADAGMGVDVHFDIEYQSAIGITVRERHRVHCSIHAGIILSGESLTSRTYHNTPRPSLEIQDP